MSIDRNIRLAGKITYLVAPVEMASEPALQRIVDFTDKILTRGIRPPAIDTVTINLRPDKEGNCSTLCSSDGSMRNREVALGIPPDMLLDRPEDNDVICLTAARLAAETEYKARRMPNLNPNGLSKARDRYRYRSYWLLREVVEKEGRSTMGVLPDLDQMGIFPDDGRRSQNIFSSVKTTGFTDSSGLFNFETE